MFLICTLFVQKAKYDATGEVIKSVEEEFLDGFNEGKPMTGRRGGGYLQSRQI